MSKTEHFDKIWSRAANQKYCDNWERTFGKKTQGGVSAPKHRAAKASPKGCDMASHAPPGAPGDSEGES